MIKKLLRLELYKTLFYTNFRVMAGLWIGLLILVVFIATQISLPLPNAELKTYLQFPSTWSTITWIASWFNLLLAIIVIVLTGNEYSFRTFRSQIINGLTRNNLILGKGLFIVFLAFCSMVIVFLITIITGFTYTIMGSEISVFSKSYLLLVYFFQAVGYMSLALLITILVKNTALAIVSFILYFFPVEPIIRNFFSDNALRFFPMKVISNLTPLPDVIHFSTAPQVQSSINGQSMEMAAPVADLPVETGLCIAIIYIAVFFVISGILMNKRNL